MSGDYFLFLVFFVSLACIGFGKILGSTDPEGKIKIAEIHDNGIGRNADELLRKVQAAQFVASHPNEVCPAKWRPGDKTLKPGLDLVGKI